MGLFGTLAGGGLAGMFFRKNKKSLMGKDAKIKDHNLLTGTQQSALKSYFNNPINKSPLYGAGASYLTDLLGGGDEAYNLMEGPIMQKYQQEIMPGIAERFAGMGTGGSLGSSGLNNSLAQAGRNLGTDLGGIRAQMQMQALPQALNYAQQPYTNKLGGLGVRGIMPYQTQAKQGLLGGLLPGLGGALGTAVAGPLGGLLGGLFGGAGK